MKTSGLYACIMSLASFGVAAEDYFAMTWSNCDSTAIAQVKSITPAMVPIGGTTTFSSVADLSAPLAGGMYDITVSKAGKVLETVTGNAADSVTKDLTYEGMFTVGTYAYQGIQFPVAAGTQTNLVKLTLDLYKNSIYNAMEDKMTLDTKMQVTTSDGKNALCLNIALTPAKGPDGMSADEATAGKCNAVCANIPAQIQKNIGCCQGCPDIAADTAFSAATLAACPSFCKLVPGSTRSKVPGCASSACAMMEEPEVGLDKCDAVCKLIPANVQKNVACCQGCADLQSSEFDVVQEGSDKCAAVCKLIPAGAQKNVGCCQGCATASSNAVEAATVDQSTGSSSFPVFAAVGAAVALVGLVAGPLAAVAYVRASRKPEAAQQLSFEKTAYGADGSTSAVCVMEV